MSQDLSMKFFYLRNYLTFAVMIFMVIIYLFIYDLITSLYIYLSLGIIILGILIIHNYGFEENELIIIKTKYLDKNKLKHKKKFDISDIIN